MKVTELPKLKDFEFIIEEYDRWDGTALFIAIAGVTACDSEIELNLSGDTRTTKKEAVHDQAIFRKGIAAMLRTMREECRK